jgi:hypothetical protein
MPRTDVEYKVGDRVEIDYPGGKFSWGYEAPLKTGGVVIGPPFEGRSNNGSLVRMVPVQTDVSFYASGPDPASIRNICMMDIFIRPAA